jgi:hypothetical protein
VSVNGHFKRRTVFSITEVFDDVYKPINFLIVVLDSQNLHIPQSRCSIPVVTIFRFANFNDQTPG